MILMKVRLRKWSSVFVHRLYSQQNILDSQSGLNPRTAFALKTEEKNLHDSA